MPLNLTQKHVKYIRLFSFVFPFVFIYSFFFLPRFFDKKKNEEYQRSMELAERTNRMNRIRHKQKNSTINDIPPIVNPIPQLGINPERNSPENDNSIHVNPNMENYRASNVKTGGSDVNINHGNITNQTYDTNNYSNNIVEEKVDNTTVQIITRNESNENINLSTHQIPLRSSLDSTNISLPNTSQVTTERLQSPSQLQEEESATFSKCTSKDVQTDEPTIVTKQTQLNDNFPTNTPNTSQPPPQSPDHSYQQLPYTSLTSSILHNTNKSSTIHSYENVNTDTSIESPINDKQHDKYPQRESVH